MQIAEVSLQGTGSYGMPKRRKSLLNNFVKGFHTHQSYEEQLKCANSGDGGFTTIEEFARLEGKGAVPCSQCGDVFSTHNSEDCPNYPYLLKRDKGFKVAYDVRVVAMGE